MSWLFSQALAEAFSAGTCWAGEPCAQLNVMPTAQPFWRNDKPMDASRPFQFGLTLRPLTADRGEALLTWYLAGFPVRTSASPDLETGSTELAAGSGENLHGSFAKYDPDTRTWKTHQSSLLGDFTEYSETWPNWGSMVDGVCWELPTLAPSTSERESGLLPTPATVDTGSMFNQSASEGAALRPTLGAMARFNLWPTPTCGGGGQSLPEGTTPQGKTPDGRKQTVCLERAVIQVEKQLWATPVRRDYRAPGRSRLERTGGKQGECLPQQVGGRLNPDWVEWLMGWPIGWTALEPLEMDRFREWQQQHGGCSVSEQPQPGADSQ